MPSMSRFTAVAVAASMTAGLLVSPGAAYAAGTTTSLSAKQMAAALKKVGAASKAAASGGWQMDESFTEGSTSGSAHMVVNPGDGVMFEDIHAGKLHITVYIVDHHGTYTRPSDATSRAALTMMDRPKVKYVFAPDKKLAMVADLASVLSPGALLADDLKHAGTKTVQNDGSAVYAFKAQGDTATLSVSPDGTLTQLKSRSKSGTMTLRFTYGVQPPELPTPAATINESELSQGIAYLHMNANVKVIAKDSAHRAQRAAHGHTVKATAVRKAARHETADFNSIIRTKMVKTTGIHGGASLQATNPWTNRTVTYTVTAHGKKVTVAKK